MICASSTAIVINASLSNRELRLMIPDDLHTAISLIYLSTNANGTNWKEKLAICLTSSISNGLLLVVNSLPGFLH